MADIKYEIVKKVGVLSKAGSGSSPLPSLRTSPVK
jgi:hypothetical protein